MSSSQLEVAQPYRGGWLSRLVGGVNFGQQQRRVLYFTYLTIKFDRINHKNLIDLLVSIMSLSQILINFSSNNFLSQSVGAGTTLLCWFFQSVR